MAFDKQKFLKRFVDEARDHIKNLNQGLISLEKKPNDTDILNGIFRSAHTIKGSSRMMKLIAISDLAHKVEDTLDSLRQHRIEQSKVLFDLLFKAIEKIEAMLDVVEAGNEVPEAPADLCKQLENASAGKLSIPKPPELPVDQSVESPPPPPPQDLKKETVSECPISKESSSSSDDKDIKPIEPHGEDKPIHEPPPDVIPDKPTSSKPSKQIDTIRVRSDRLDDLIRLIGEIVSGYSREKHRLFVLTALERQLKQFVETIGTMVGSPPSEINLPQMFQKIQSVYLTLHRFCTEIKEDLNNKRLIIEDLQDTSLKMRMLPLSTIFDGFQMSVRNLSRSFGKEVELIVEGADTELDKKIIEKIGDPILHMIRNSIDHGIESAEQRIKSGKPPVGTIRLSAEYEGGQVLIKISDDGGGIPIEKIKQKAIKKKLIKESAIQNISESDLINLIFQPGFSTSDIITDISGRGVGMDVVKQNIIDLLKGSIQISTEAGKGTTFYIRLPLTIAIIHVLIILAENMVFAIPANHIEEIIRISCSQIIDVTNRKAIRLRNQLIPIVPLKDILFLPTNHSKTENNSNLILIVSSGHDKLGLIIDSLISEEDVVVKQLPPLIKHIPFVSGAIIGDNNRLVNVLHIAKIAEAAKEVKIRKDIAPTPVPEKKNIQILLVEDSYSTREIEKSILESYGYQVTLATDGLEGLEKAQSSQYDLIITDIEMPRMNGFTLTEMLRKEEAYKDVPIILVTSLDKEEDKRRGIQVGANAYIVKGSFDQATLIDSVRNLIG